MSSSSQSEVPVLNGPRRLVRYVGWSLLPLVALAVPARMAGSGWGPVLAWVLTFVPGAAVVAMSHRFHDSRRSLEFVLLSTMFRMATAGAGAALVLWVMPTLVREQFLIWLAGMYLLALCVEVCLTLSVGSLRTLWQAGSSRPQSVTNFSEAGR